MNQDKISEITRKAIEVPAEFTQSLMEKTDKVKTPSPRIDKIGRSIGACAGAVLLLTGSAVLLFGKSLWAIGILSVGAFTVISNILRLSRNKKTKI